MGIPDISFSAYLFTACFLLQELEVEFSAGVLQEVHLLSSHVAVVV